MWKPYKKPFTSGWTPKARCRPFSTLKTISFVNTLATQQTDPQGLVNADAGALGLQAQARQVWAGPWGGFHVILWKPLLEARPVRAT